MSLDAYLNNRWIRAHETSAREMFDLARRLRSRVESWLKRTHPHLLR